MALSVQQGQRQTQGYVLAQAQRRGLEILAMSLPELRAETARELAGNPLIESVGSPLDEKTFSDVATEADARARDEARDYSGDREDLYATPAYSGDADALERRQAFFDRQTASETLEEHLLRQLPLADVAPADFPACELLVGSLNEHGYFAGSFPDLVMTTGRSEAELRALLRKIASLDPPGCGATTLAECYEAQLDDVPAADRADVRRLVARHLDDLAAGRRDEVARALGVDDARLSALLARLRALEPYPGRAFAPAGKGVEFVNPEIHAARVGGKWIALVDARGLPELRMSAKYVRMLEDPAVSDETKAYVRRKIASFREFQQAVKSRQYTVRTVAQEIFDAQPGFFEKGLAGLRPLTQEEIARRVGLDPSTVSRTVNGKFAATPRGTVELRRFFVQGVTTDSGRSVSRADIETRLRELVDGEDRARPYSDERLAALLKAEGFGVARRTVAKYRTLLGLPYAAERAQSVSKRDGT